MKFHFPQLFVPEAPKLEPKEVLKLAILSKTDVLNDTIKSVVSNNFRPPRSLEAIFQDIEQGKIQNITPLEWLYCLSAKNHWNNNKSGTNEYIAQIIWKISENKPWLKRHLFWCLVIYYGENKKQVNFPSSLLKYFKSYHPQTHEDKQTVEIIKSLQASDTSKQLAEMSLENLLTPQQLFEQYYLPKPTHIIKEVLNQVSCKFISLKKANCKQEQWLIDCLHEMSQEQEIEGVNQLLQGISSQQSRQYPNLVQWIKCKYNPILPLSPWQKLSKQAKIALRKWLGSVNYQDFKQLVDLLLKTLHLEFWETNQLKKRRDFWSNYSDQFVRIRILLPCNSALAIKGNLSSQNNISLLQEDGSDMTEVCILDFGEWFVVEFFRGTGSETRLLKANSSLEQELFNSHNLSIKYLRSLGGDVHDHVICWQYYCEQWLRKRKIFPNEGIRYFEGVPPKYGKYNRSIGMPTPSFEDQLKRQKKLRYWRRDMDILKVWEI
jgi:hypothetical protein